jgi:ATP-binding cassette, subfamily C (CFTR/MRP), member 1
LYDIAIWLKQWSDANATGNADNGLYLGVYAALGISSTLLAMWSCWELFVHMITRSLRNMHQSLLSTVFRAPLTFFQLTDIGSITNRFSQDMELVGLDFPLVAINYVSAALNCLAQILILAIYAKFLAVTGPFVVSLVFVLQKFYLRTSRQMRLLDIEAKAPLFSQFIETTSGSATIRAFGWQQHFQERLTGLLDRSQRPVYLLYCVQQWLALILDLIVSALAIILVAIVVNWRSSFDPGSVGVALVMVMTFNRTLMFVVKFWTMLETSVGAVSRIKRFEEETEHEEGPRLDESPRLSNWPFGGAVAFSNVQASYGYGRVHPHREPYLKYFADTP